MLFNSLDFALFLPIVFVLYWFVLHKSLKAQNALVFMASYVFYGWWDCRFLSLLLFSTILNFFTGIGLGKYQKDYQRKLLLWISIIINLSFLGFFKYYNFFLDSLVQIFSFMGSPITVRGLDIVLPVGISFYTFQTMSYSLDVYYEKLEPTKDFIAFGAFVSFFPLLLAGPIERGTNLLPQFFTKRSFDYAKALEGCHQILWGLFKKIVIADNCAEYANTIFENYQDYNGATLFLGTVFFAFQIYGDFSGYSDIAIGISRFFGFSLLQNFNYPYFAINIPDFWKRWHISLSTWLNDYLFQPLALKYRNDGKWGIIKAVIITFLISGLWHGASWHFVIWGTIHGFLYLPTILLKPVKNPFKSTTIEYPKLQNLHRVLITFVLICFTYIFFRASDLKSAVDYTRGILTFQHGISLTLQGLNLYQFSITMISIIFLIYQDYHQAKNAKFTNFFVPTTLFMIMYFGYFKSTTSFIYFQF